MLNELTFPYHENRAWKTVIWQQYRTDAQSVSFRLWSESFFWVHLPRELWVWVTVEFLHGCNWVTQMASCQTNILHSPCCDDCPTRNVDDLEPNSRVVSTEVFLNEKINDLQEYQQSSKEKEERDKLQPWPSYSIFWLDEVYCSGLIDVCRTC